MIKHRSDTWHALMPDIAPVCLILLQFGFRTALRLVCRFISYIFV